MKIQIYIPQYKDLTPQFEDCQMVPIDQLNNVPDSTCTLVHLGNCCDFVTERLQLLQHAIQKLRYGGNIIVEGTDLMEVSICISHGILQIADVQNLLFHGRFSGSTMINVVQDLQRLKLHIIKNRLMQYKYLIKAERPHVN